MNKFLKIIFICSLLCSVSSCYVREVRHESVDIYSNESIPLQLARVEIEHREKKISEINREIQRIEKYNNKLKHRIEIDNSYNLYDESLNKTFYKNIEIIYNLRNDIELLKKEIRVIKRRAGILLR